MRILLSCLAGAAFGFLTVVAIFDGWCAADCPAIEPEVIAAYRDCGRIIRGDLP